MALATVLGFAGGYTFGLWPLVRQGMSWTQALRTIWLGETISIAAMEFAMNFTDYHMGGLQATSLRSVQFWLGYAAAVHLPLGGDREVEFAEDDFDVDAVWEASVKLGLNF